MIEKEMENIWWICIGSIYTYGIDWMRKRVQERNEVNILRFWFQQLNRWSYSSLRMGIQVKSKICGEQIWWGPNTLWQTLQCILHWKYSSFSYALGHRFLSLQILNKYTESIFYWCLYNQILFWNFNFK